MTQGPITILVVEDEAQVSSLLNAMLEDAGFEVIVAEDGAGALHQLWKRSGNLALLITDIDMGRMNGIELAEMVRSQYPVVPILFISGLPVPTTVIEKAAPGISLLAKPFDQAALVQAVKKAIADLTCPRFLYQMELEFTRRS